jgi:putative addiction module component (TIGR02574 family)
MAEPAFNIDDLSQEERLTLLEQLWDSLTSDPGAVPFTPAQRAELDHRLDEIERGEVDGIPWEDVVRQIRGRQQ